MTLPLTALARVVLVPAALGIVVVSTGAALAEPGDPRVVQGTLEWPATTAPNEPFIVVRGDDGRAYCADLTAAQRRTRDPLTSGSRLSLLGIEGSRPHELAAMVIGTGDAASLGLAPTFTSPGSAAAGAVPAAATDSMWRVDGTVQAVSGTRVTLRGPQGDTSTVDVSNLSESTRAALRPGERISLFGVLRPDQRLVANGYIQSRDAVPPAASPRMPR